MFFKQIQTLHDYLTLNTMENAALAVFQALPDKGMQLNFVLDLVNREYFDLIVKLACDNDDFYTICTHESLSTIWIQCWSTYGIILTRDQQKSLYYQPSEDPFTLFLGIFFYEKSVNIKNCRPNSFLYIELNYLKKALSYHSIHACQRYQEYCFFMGETHNELAFKTFSYTIGQIKRLLPFYTTYAYLMLAETFVRFGVYLQGISTPSHTANDSFEAALTAVRLAKKSYTSNDPAIFNASLGEGLSLSNTLHLDDFALLEIFVERLISSDEKFIDPDLSSPRP